MSDSNPSDEHQRRVTFLSGQRQITIGALREKIETQFNAEMPPDVANRLPIADREEKLREVTDYILETESVRLTRSEKGALIQDVYADLFTFGALDSYLAEDSITEITLDGYARLFTRHGQNAPQSALSEFESNDQYRKIINRALSQTGRSLDDGDVFIEAGANLLGRPARLTVALPPISPQLHTEIRLHPTTPITLDDLLASGYLSQTALDFIEMAITDGRGLMIAGDVNTGKTTLVQALLDKLPGGSAVVERAAEMTIPPGFERFSGRDFVTGIDDAVLLSPPWLVLDEVRFDEAAALWTILKEPPASKLLWALRGAIRADRLFASFSMSIRRAEPTVEESAIVTALVERLPCVILCGRREGSISVVSVGQWVEKDGRAVLEIQDK